MSQTNLSVTGASVTGAGTAAESAPPVLEIENLRTWFFTRDGIVKSVDGVSYAVGNVLLALWGTVIVALI